MPSFGTWTAYRFRHANDGALYDGPTHNLAGDSPCALKKKCCCIHQDKDVP